ncbi:MAG TPA: hypothetical protein EYP98_03020, partial [Planctomycetes bacterium]|nr:hypothetical protein [Planctomycetota bacterium]
GLVVEANGPGATGFATPGLASEALGIGVALLVLILTFGSLVAAGLPIITALIGVGIGLTGVTAMTALVDISSSTSILATMIGLAVGIDYTLFILARYRTELHHTDDRARAVGIAVGTAGHFDPVAKSDHVVLRQRDRCDQRQDGVLEHQHQYGRHRANAGQQPARVLAECPRDRRDRAYDVDEDLDQADVALDRALVGACTLRIDFVATVDQTADREHAAQGCHRGQHLLGRLHDGFAVVERWVETRQVCDGGCCDQRRQHVADPAKERLVDEDIVPGVFGAPDDRHDHELAQRLRAPGDQDDQHE